MLSAKYIAPSWDNRGTTHYDAVVKYSWDWNAAPPFTLCQRAWQASIDKLITNAHNI